MRRFEIIYDMGKRGLTTLFKHKLFTIDAAERKDWDYNHLDEYLVDYKICVDQNVLNAISPTTKALLNDMLEERSVLTLKNNKGARYSGNRQYIKCYVPVFVLNYLKRIFASTIIYETANREMPKTESISFLFENHGVGTESTVTITDIKTYEPTDDPYYVYARNAVASLTIEAIGVDRYGFSEDGKVKDFYNWDKISKWKKSSDLFIKNGEGIIQKTDKDGIPAENAINGEPGIYMLYNEQANEFYLGKARNLRERIMQHAMNVQGNDPMPDFTHYRYSAINPEYFEFLYLIENAGIHDAAWIIDMPKAQKYKPALSHKTDNSLNKCRIVNTHERQRKKENGGK